MHYKIRRNIEIRTENAAKPHSQASSFLLGLICGLPAVSATFDYGCGKLRYQRPITETTDTLALVDFEIQLSRTQILHGNKTSIRTEFMQSNQITVHSDVEFREVKTQFDRGFCINVLSEIPSLKHRSQVAATIRERLRPNGKCLFVVQYRNSDFTRMENMTNAKPWLDRFLVDLLRGYSFYGLIPPARLEMFLRRSGFRICETKLNEGSVYTWATPVR